MATIATSTSAPAVSGLHFKEISATYNFTACKWSASAPLQDDNFVYVPSFEEMQAAADSLDVTNRTSGKIIAFFTLRKKTTIIVQPDHGVYCVLSTRSLLKKESVKLSNTVKKVAGRTPRKVESDISNIGILEKSCSGPVGFVCNFTGIQNSDLFISRAGTITNINPDTTFQLGGTTDLTDSGLGVTEILVTEPELDLGPPHHQVTTRSFAPHIPSSPVSPIEPTLHSQHFQRQYMNRKSLFPDSEFLCDNFKGIIGLFLSHYTYLICHLSLLQPQP